MSSVVQIDFRPSANLGRPVRLPLSELGGFLAGLGPDALRLEVVRTAREGTLATLRAEFPDTSTVSPGAYLKQAVARLEGDADFEAGWGERPWFTSTEHWSFVEPAILAGQMQSGKPIGFVFEPLRVAEEVLKWASLNDVDVYMGAQVDRTPAGVDRIRELVPALAELEISGGRPDLHAALSHAIALGRQAGWRSREVIGLPASRDAFRTVIDQSINDLFRKTAPFLTDDFLCLDWTDIPFEEEAGPGLGRMVSSLRSADYVATLFNRLFAPSSPMTRITGFPGTDPVRSEADGSFAFVSYSHRNRPFVDELTRALGASRIPFWFDSGIEPGAIWDEALERRIRNCSALIACVSSDYEASRYCRRELKFADLIGKPVLPLSDGAWNWGPGLQMMFQEYQIQNVRSDGGWTRAVHGLSRLVPGLVPGG